MTTDAGMDVSPSWQELKEQNENLRGNLDIAINNEERMSEQLRNIAPCIFHDDRRDECLIYSGQIPCMTQTEMDEIRATGEPSTEKDKLSSELAVTEAELRAVREERDALAAHVERFHELANVANLLDADDVCEQLVAIDDEAPTTSLARLKAEWQAEAIHRLHNRYMTETGGNGSISGYVWDELSELRRQAEEK